MKFSNLLSLAVYALSATPVLGCLELFATAEYDSEGNYDFNSGAGWALDNGVFTCQANNGVRTDQDGHWSLGCEPGFVYAFSKDLTNVWYGTPWGSWHWTVSPEFVNWGDGKFHPQYDFKNWC